MSRQSDYDLLDEAKRRIEMWYSYWSEANEHFRNDRRFLFSEGAQWDDDVRDERERLDLVTIEMNVLKPAINGIIGELLPTMPIIRATPGQARRSDVASTESDLIDGLLHAIQEDSDAGQSYQQLLKDMLCGYGAIRLKTAYESSDSMNQRVEIHVLTDPQYAFFDPSAQKLTKCDGEFCGFYCRVGKDAFITKHSRELYEQVVHDDSLAPASGVVFEWRDADAEEVTVCYYWFKEYFKKTIIQLTNGDVIEESRLVEYLDEVAQKQLEAMGMEQGIPNAPDLPASQREEMLDLPTEVSRRKVVDYRIRGLELVGNRILSKSVWNSKEMPVYFADGASNYIDGRQELEPFIKNAKDAQRVLNYVVSDLAQSMKNRPRGKWVVTAKEQAGYEDDWNRPEENLSALRFNAQPGLGRPMFNQPPPFPQQLADQVPMWIRNIYIALGRTSQADSPLSREMSGVAILARISQDNHGVRQQYENLLHVVKKLGEGIIALLPAVYSGERLLKIYASDNTTDYVMINTPGEFGQLQHDLSHSDYNVDVKAGAPSDLSRMAEQDQLAHVIPLLSQPDILPYADILAKTLSPQIAQEVVNRAELVQQLRAPALVAQLKGKPLPPPPPPSPAHILKERLDQEDMQADIRKKVTQADLNEAMARVQQTKAMVEPQKLDIEMEKMQSQERAQVSKENMEYRKMAAEIDKTNIQANAEVEKDHNNQFYDWAQSEFANDKEL